VPDSRTVAERCFRFAGRHHLKQVTHANATLDAEVP
jgi:hypothetical protein